MRRKNPHFETIPPPLQYQFGLQHISETLIVDPELRNTQILPHHHTQSRTIPPMKKPIVITTAVLVVFFTTAALWTYFNYFHTKPLTPQEQTLLTPDWSKITHNNWSPWITLPDGTKQWNPATSYNNWLSTIPDEDKAWPILVDTWLANLDYTLNLPTGFFPEEDLLWDVHKDEYKSQRFRDITDRLATAANKPVMGIGLYMGTDPYEHSAMIKYDLEDEFWDPTPHPNPPVIGALYGDLGQSRSATNHLQTAAVSALLNNNPNDYLRYTTATIELAKLSVHYPTAIHQLVQIAILDKATDLVRWGLANNQAKFTTEQLARLDQALAQYDPIYYEWEGEALQFHDKFRRFAGQDGRISLFEQTLKLTGQRGLSIENPPANLPDTQLGPSIQQPLHIYNKLNKQIAEQSNTIFNNFISNPTDVYEVNRTKLNKVTDPLLGTIANALTRIPARYRDINQQLRATRIAIALHIYHNTRNEYPESLDQLNLPERILLDEFTGKQLLYKRSPSGPVLYSTGDNREDNNATQRLITKHHGGPDDAAPYTIPYTPRFISQSQAENTQPPPTDWVLYPLPFGNPKQLYIPEEDLP